VIERIDQVEDAMPTNAAQLPEHVRRVLDLAGTDPQMTRNWGFPTARSTPSSSSPAQSLTSR
jgi:hypothetical protein